MGGNVHSKSQTSSSSSRDVARVDTRPARSRTASDTAEPIELMLVLITAGIVPDVGLIIMSYATPSLSNLRRTSSFDSKHPDQFFTSRLQYTFFGYNVSDLVEAVQHCLFGRFDEVKSILERNQNPALLTTCMDGQDHRGPNFTPSATLFEHALLRGDVLIVDAKSGETMAGMLQAYVIKRCGQAEYKKQLERARQIMGEEDEKKATMESEDIRALDAVWNALRNANKEKLKSDKRLRAALAAFDSQLKKLGNDKILQEISKRFTRDYDPFGFYNSAKNNYVADKIWGLAQRERLPACELQLSFFGISNVLSGGGDKFVVRRIDVRKELGILSTGSPFQLGSNCHLNIDAVITESSSCARRTEAYYSAAADQQWPWMILQSVASIRHAALQKIMWPSDNLPSDKLMTCTSP